MRTLFRAAIAALSVASISPAIAGEGEGTIANTQFTELAGVMAQRPVADAWPPAVAQAHGSAYVLATQSNHVVSLFALYDQNGGGGNE
jgi:hypothetical protein